MSKKPLSEAILANTELKQLRCSRAQMGKLRNFLLNDRDSDRDSDRDRRELVAHLPWDPVIVDRINKQQYLLKYLIVRVICDERPEFIGDYEIEDIE